MTKPGIRRVLVANRGEIALRIFRSCRELGIGTVAVYSDADVDAAHVAAADEAVRIGPAPARESYLIGANIIAAAQQAGADAVHPGYGFLSENAAFAEAVSAAGLTWIGPSPDTIRAMGDKQRARDIAAKAGVPIVPGSRRFAEGDVADVEDEGRRVGYPLLVKAAAGGGGIGMRRVDEPAQLATTVAATQSMAAKAFGDGSVFLERYVPKARHVEIQVFGYGNGRAIHLFERDCSIQRRYQKVMEESPAPGLPASVRTAMAEAALKLARAVDYEGAGTVEFIVDAQSFDFFFLEMNTRIQVEHPVTEMVTGRDLVAMQIRLAAGALEPLAQDQIVSRGHAIECRLYAENPAKMFMPSPGHLDVLRLPQTREDLRVDCGYREGDTVTPYYDPMIAKIIAWGADRDAARAGALKALRDLRIDGIRSNRDFLIACLADQAFAEGDVHTGFIETRHAALIAG